MFRQVYKTFEQYYFDLFDVIVLAIKSEKDAYIIAQPSEDLVTYYLSNCLDPIELDQENEELFDPQKYIKTIPAHQREWGFQNSGDLKYECEKVVLKLPILPNRNTEVIINLNTNIFSSSGDPSFKISENYIVLELETKGYGFDLANEEISSKILNYRAEVHHYLTRKRSEILSENAKLESRLIQFINDRKQKLDSDQTRINELVKLVKIPLVRKDGDFVKKIIIDQRPFINKIKPKPFEEDYQLDRDKVIDIISLLNNQCMQFEKTPKTYQKLDEPNLRDLLLSNLNSVFEGKATGETFNNHGKTDIYLIIDKGNILVAECKFYGGEKLYHDTLDQILGYLSWRHNFGIMISFCKQKNFSKILSEAEAVIKKHGSYNNGFYIKQQNHIISKHTLPVDDYKFVEIHHLYYNLHFA
jgi:hypothetical protein